MQASRIHRRKPAGKPMPQNTARANAAISSVRAHPCRTRLRPPEEQVRLFIRTIGIARAEANLILANIADNSDRLIFHERARAIMRKLVVIANALLEADQCWLGAFP
jgi:hypothetical protein